MGLSDISILIAELCQYVPLKIEQKLSVLFSPWISIAPSSSLYAIEPTAIGFSISPKGTAVQHHCSDSRITGIGVATVP